MAVADRLTLDEFLRRPETKPAGEYICGEAVQKPMPEWNHAKIQVYLATLLFHFLASTRLGDVLTELRCIFGPPGGGARVHTRPGLHRS